jgi:hypothetical protein
MLDPIHSYWQLVEPVFSKIDISSDEATFLTSTTNIPRPVVLLYTSHFCLSEIHNGGLLQFYWNSTGLIAPAIEGFKVIGMPKLASFLETAAAALGLPYPRDRSARWDALLAASGLDEQELKRIFEDAPNFYLAFAESTRTLFPDELNQQAWNLAKDENGGFQEAATRYAVNSATDINVTIQ